MEKKRKHWTQKEKDLLKKIYPNSGWDEMIDIFQTNKEAIIQKASDLGLKREGVQYAKWNNEEISFLKENIAKMSKKEIAEKIGRTVCSVESKAKKLHLDSGHFWSDEEICLLKENFGDYTDEELAEIFLPKRNPITIKSMGRRLGLKKNYKRANEKQFSKEQLLEDIKKVYNKLGRTPLLTELRLYGLPSERTLLRYFPEGYKGICKRFGWKENKNLFGNSAIYYSRKNEICYSKAEVAISDFLFFYDIPYRKEELLYKDIFGIDEFETKRIDWLLEDNTVIEYFGMMNNERYKKKAESKIYLCKKYNINLIEIYPTDLKDLHKIFKKYIKNNTNI